MFKFIQGIFPVLLLLISITVYGQDWSEMMQDVNKYSFVEIQEAFNEQWKGKEIVKGKGYKQYKRWEHYWESRLMPDGSFPNPGYALQELQSFKRSQNRGARSTVLANWQSIGPSTSSGGYAGIGRIGAIAFHPTNADIIYAGAAGGGLWKSLDGGNTWNTYTDNLATLGVSGIVVDEVNPDIVYIATGDADAADNYSVGVLKSIDGGQTFNATGLNWSLSSGRLIKRLIVDPNDNNTLIAATTLGIYRTTNAAVSWTQEISGSYVDVEPMYGSSSNTFYAASSNAIYKSTDNGDTWNTVYTVPNSNRLAIATTPADEDFLYVLSSGNSNGSNGGNGFNGLWRSTDNGVTFANMSTSPNILTYSSNGSGSGGQGWYDLALAADPSNASIIYIGGVNCWKSTNGGSTWSLKSHWSGANGVQTVHADKHVLEFRGSVLWEGNDGGLYKTTNGGTNWTHLSNGMVISQMYKIGASQSDNKVICGLQDNGTKLKETSGLWDDVLGGDGMECAIDAFDSDVMYGEYQRGGIRRSTNGGNNWTNIQANIPGDSVGNWVTPFVLDVLRPDTILVGYEKVYRSFNRGTSWTAISSNLAGGNNLNYLRVAESNPDYVYAGRSNQLWRTTNGGASWQTMTTPGSSTQTVIIHPNNPDSIWTVRSNYTNSAKVYVSGDGGATWSNISFNLPNVPVNTIVYENGTNNGLYIGTDAGIYYTENNSNVWELYADDLPNVNIMELEINYADQQIYAATYGRGLWKSDLHTTNPCFYPENLVSDSVGVNYNRFRWETPNVDPSNGYEYAINNSATPPSGGISTLDTFVVISGLDYTQDYYLHARSDCGGGSTSSWITYGPFKPLPTCGDNVYDSGGSFSDYSNEEDYTLTICPEVAGNNVVLTFNSIDIETNWDALYVFDGPTINSTQFSSPNSSTQAGFPAGGYYGSVSPGPFTSTDLSGCITIRFMSDTYVTGDGWDATVSCIGCAASSVNTIEDNVIGSLRYMLSCNINGGNIPFDLALVGDTLKIESGPLLIDNNFQLDNTIGTIYIESYLTQPMIDITGQGNLFINNFRLLAAPNIPVIKVQGVLSIQNLSIQKDNNQIMNMGTLDIRSNGQLMVE